MAYAAAGRLEEAAQTLERAAAMGIAAATESRAELGPCRAHPACGAALAAIGRNRQPKATSTVAFTFPGPGLIPEGLAYDPATDAFFVSSVRERKILKVDRAQRTSRSLADRGAGLWAALGMAVDGPRRRLWVATSALPEMADALPADEGRAALVAFDLDSGRSVARHELPRDRHHVLGDVIVTPAGDVFTTDSTSPAIYRLPVDGRALETLAAGEPFVSLQGLALSADGARLFVTDYAKGIFAIDLVSRRVRLLDAPRTAGLLGIDGLYRVGGALLGIQNGTDPPRLLRLVGGRRSHHVRGRRGLRASRGHRSHPGRGGGEPLLLHRQQPMERGPAGRKGGPGGEARRSRDPGAELLSQGGHLRTIRDGRCATPPETPLATRRRFAAPPCSAVGLPTARRRGTSTPWSSLRPSPTIKAAARSPSRAAPHPDASAKGSRNAGFSSLPGSMIIVFSTRA